MAMQRTIAQIGTAVILGLLAVGCGPSNTFVAPPPPEVTVQQPDQREVTVHVSMPGRIQAKETVEIRARVSGNGKQDGFEIALPAHQPTTPRSRLVGEGRLRARQTVPLHVPSGVRPDSREAIITVAPSVLGSLESGLEALLDYPHGCAEQKTSRLIPMVALGDLVRDLSLGRLSDLVTQEFAPGVQSVHLGGQDAGSFQAVRRQKLDRDGGIRQAAQRIKTGAQLEPDVFLR